MKKLYFFNEKEKCYYYDEAWINGDKIIEHIGKLGTKGRTKTYPLDPAKTGKKNISLVLQPAIQSGYKEIPQIKLYTLLVEYIIDGFGTPQDIEKIHKLQDHMNETLGWTGLGHCDGNSIGSDTMEVCCFVVNFELAKKVIAKSLKGTEFDDYSRIYDENA